MKSVVRYFPWKVISKGPDCRPGHRAERQQLPEPRLVISLLANARTHLLHPSLLVFLVFLPPHTVQSHASSTSSPPSHAFLHTGTTPTGHGHGFRTGQELPGWKFRLQFYPVCQGVPLFPPVLLVHQRDPGLSLKVVTH